MLIVGLDGGGTKTVAWLAPLDDLPHGSVLGRGHAGPGNPRAAGFDVAQANIWLAIEAAFRDAQLPRQKVAAACFGLAGAGRQSEQRQIAEWAKNTGIAERVHVCGDAEPVLAAASPDNTGIALICGTGSLAWGRNAFGETARCGGWGYLLGDEGSGYWIAKAGLAAAMRAADGRGQPTQLLDRFLEQLQAATPSELVERVYSSALSREGLAALASVVFAAAESDPAAKEIISDAAQELARMVSVLAVRLQLPGNYSLAMTGGLLLNQPLLFQQLLIQLNRATELANNHAVPRPVAGALALARSLATRP